MQVEEATAKYNIAERLFREGQCAAALEVLDELNAAYPRTHRIMLARAMCLASLFRAQEAVLLCDRIIGRFHCPQAQKLKEQLIKSDGVPTMPVRDADVPLPPLMLRLDEPMPQHGSSSSPAKPGGNRWLLVVLGVTILILLAFYVYCLAL
jgi:hypothetical protein